MDLPKNNEDYRTREYWDTRYKTEESYDWFKGYSSFQHLLKDDVDPPNSILMLGCGNSTLSEEMYKDGYRHITNVDFSPIVIEKMAEKHKALPEMTWVVGDIADLKFDPGTFDVVIEKGTLDALMVHEKDPWNTSQETLDLVDAILKQISTVLKDGGKFISITFAQPHFRKPLYACAKYNWSVSLSNFGTTFHFFYFAMKKGELLSDNDKQEEVERERKRLKETQDEVPVFLKDDDKDEFLCGIDL